MFKLTVIGAALAACAFASEAHSFKNKFAMKSHQSVNPSYVAPYVRDMLNCWDDNGDGVLNRTELETMVAGQLSGVDCPTAGDTLLSGSDINLLRSWIGYNASISRIYYAPASGINKASLLNAIQGKANLVFVGKTTSGYEIGGYTGSAVIPNYSTATWITGSNMFMFSLNLQAKYSTAYSSLNIWINTQSTYDDIIDFGYANALQFETSVSGAGWVNYKVNNDFYSPPSVASMTGAADYVNLANFEVYQVSF